MAISIRTYSEGESVNDFDYLSMVDILKSRADREGIGPEFKILKSQIKWANGRKGFLLQGDLLGQGQTLQFCTWSTVFERHSFQLMMTGPRSMLFEVMQGSKFENALQSAVFYSTP